MKFLKQSTPAIVPMGPFLSPADGLTLVTSLISTLDNGTTGIFLIKNGGSGAIRDQASLVATTYDAYGMYLVRLDAVDTGTLGRLRVYFAAAASCLPVWEDFQVLPAAIFDSLVTGSGGAIPNAVAGAVSGLVLNDATTAYTPRSIYDVVNGRLPAALTTNGNIKASLMEIITTALTAQIAAAWVKFFDKASPTGTVNSLPDAVPGTQAGLATVATGGLKLAQTVDLTAGQTIAATVASVPDSAGVTTLLSRIGTLTGTGVNTVLGFFKALLSKAATLPSDIGGTFDPATDSTEAIRDTAPLGTAMRGTDNAALAASVPTAAQTADTILGRNLAGGSDGGRTVKDALRAGRNKTEIVNGTLTVYAEDDATAAWSAAITTSPGNPINKVDPS